MFHGHLDYFQNHVLEACLIQNRETVAYGHGSWLVCEVALYLDFKISHLWLDLTRMITNGHPPPPGGRLLHNLTRVIANKFAVILTSISCQILTHIPFNSYEWSLPPPLPLPTLLICYKKKRNDGPNHTYPPFGSLSLSTSIMKALGHLLLIQGGGGGGRKGPPIYVMRTCNLWWNGLSYPFFGAFQICLVRGTKTCQFLEPWVGAHRVEWWRCSKHVSVLVLYIKVYIERENYVSSIVVCSIQCIPKYVFKGL
jgi:hypothetical protein